MNATFPVAAMIRTLEAKAQVTLATSVRCSRLQRLHATFVPRPKIVAAWVTRRVSLHLGRLRIWPRTECLSNELLARTAPHNSEKTAFFAFAKDLPSHPKIRMRLLMCPPLPVSPRRYARIARCPHSKLLTHFHAPQTFRGTYLFFFNREGDFALTPFLSACLSLTPVSI